MRHGQGGRLANPIKRLLNRPNVSAWLWRMSWVGNLDLGIACGGPLITPHVSHAGLGLMFHHMHGSFASKGRPVLNLSVGSCYPCESVSRNSALSLVFASFSISIMVRSSSPSIESMWRSVVTFFI